ncbi:hypothetical protein HDU96_002432, partial [Phlyctochytrium bullatum]
MARLIEQQLAGIDATLSSLEGELHTLAGELSEVVSSMSALEERLDACTRDDPLIGSLQKRLDRLANREDALRLKERDLRAKERLIREERMAVLGVWKQVATDSSAAGMQAMATVSEAAVLVSSPIAETGSQPQTTLLQAQAGSADELLTLITPPVSPAMLDAANAAEPVDPLDLADTGHPDEIEVTQEPSMDIPVSPIDKDLPHTPEIQPVAPDAPDLPPTPLGATSETPASEIHLHPDLELHSQPDHSNILEAESIASSFDHGSEDNVHDEDGYCPPPLGLRSVRHGSLAKGLPISPPSSSLERGAPNRRSISGPSSPKSPTRDPHHAITALSTENTEDVVLDEDMSVKPNLARLMQQFLAPTPPTPHTSRTGGRGRESPVSGGSGPQTPTHLPSSLHRGIPISRVHSSAGKLHKPTTPGASGSPNMRTPLKPRSSTSGIPVPLSQLGRSFSGASVASTTSSLPSYTPDPIPSEEDSEELMWIQGPGRATLPSPILERRRESLRSTKDFGHDDPGTRWHVMVSYCWDDVNLPCDPRRIAHHLADAGLSVWLDIERLDARRPLIPQLVDGILRSDVVIVCVSNAWSRSSLCNKEFRLLAQLRVPFLVVQIGETRPGCWRRIARITLDEHVAVDAVKPKNLKATLDTIVSETRWLISRKLNATMAADAESLTPAYTHRQKGVSPSPSGAGSPKPPSMTRLGRSGSTSSSSPTPLGVSGIPLSSHALARTASQRSTPDVHHHHYPSDLPCLTILKTLAERGNILAQFRLGVLNDSGLVIPRLASDISEAPGNPTDKLPMHAKTRHDARLRSAFHWFSAAAERGHRDAVFRLGNLYEKGRGTAKDLQRAKELYEKASADGCPDSSCALAGVLRELAKQDAKAEAQTADTQNDGSGGDEKPRRRKASKWPDVCLPVLEQAAGKGSLRAMFRLAI